MIIWKERCWICWRVCKQPFHRQRVRYCNQSNIFCFTFWSLQFFHGIFQKSFSSFFCSLLLLYVKPLAWRNFRLVTISYTLSVERLLLGSMVNCQIWSCQHLSYHCANPTTKLWYRWRHRIRWKWPK